MTASEAIYAALTADTAVAALVGVGVYPVTATKGARDPYVIFQQIGGDPGATHSGAVGATIRLFQFACFARTYEAAGALRDAVIAALDGVTIGNGDNPTVTDERDGELDTAANLYRADADFEL